MERWAAGLVRSEQLFTARERGWMDGWVSERPPARIGKKYFPAITYAQAVFRTNPRNKKLLRFHFS
jgi:hypothetical protein